MNNSLLVSINEFYKEITELSARASISRNFVKGHEEHLAKTLKQNSHIFSSTTVYRNLAQLGKGPNLYPTGYIFELKEPELKEEIEHIISRELNLNLSQAYEAFETYLLEILTEFLFVNQKHLKTLKVISTKLWLPKETIRVEVKSKLREKNNRKLVSSIRKLSAFFKRHENENIWDVEISVWFDVLSEIRHNIIHNRQAFSVKLISYFKDQRCKKIFDRYFEERVVKGKRVIHLTDAKFSQNIDLLLQFADLIFRSLSMEAGLNPVYRKL